MDPIKSPFIEVNGRRIGPGYPAYIVAELSANHQQKYEQAESMLRAAKEAGADAVKLQTYTPDTLTLRSDKECFRIKGGTLWDGKTLYDLYGEAYMPWDWHAPLKKTADEIKLDLFSTAFDPTAVDYLENVGVPFHKVASFEIVDIPLIEKMAATGKPLIISTGMTSLEEVQEAVSAAKNAGATQIIILKCTSEYPADPKSINLKAIQFMQDTFQIPIGFSDHTLGFAVPVAAVALGACMIEKHFTLSRFVPTADAAFSLEPQEFKAMVDAIRSAEASLGESRYDLGKRESNSRQYRRSLFAVEDIKRGELFTSKNVRSIRPAHGLPPKYQKDILGRYAAENIEKGTPLEWKFIEGKH